MNEEQKEAIEIILCAVSRQEIYLSTAMKQIEAIWPKAAGGE